MAYSGVAVFAGSVSTVAEKRWIVPLTQTSSSSAPGAPSVAVAPTSVRLVVIANPQASMNARISRPLSLPALTAR